MCPDGAALGLYHADAIRSHLAKHGPQNSASGLVCCGFARFERDLFREFEPKCDILPRAGGYPKAGHKRLGRALVELAKKNGVH
jgi:hypothetical protein